MNQEKQESFYKMWDVLQPFVVYYILHFVIFYLLLFLFQVSLETFGQSYVDYVTVHAATVTGIVSGAAMLFAAVPLVPMLKRELHEGGMPGPKAGLAIIILTAVLAVASSVGLNILFGITGILEASDTFQEVSRRQFGVAFGIGIILYGIVSPLAEEVVFRGLLYNRMRKYYPVWLAIFVSGFLFGVYHGNLIQGIYGSCLGILMAYLYERTGRFFIPLLFHATANISVYTLTCMSGLEGELFRTLNCVILLTISLICILLVEISTRVEKK